MPASQGNMHIIFKAFGDTFIFLAWDQWESGKAANGWQTESH